MENLNFIVSMSVWLNHEILDMQFHGKPVYCAHPDQYKITSTVLTIDWRHGCILRFKNSFHPTYKTT